MLEKVTVFITRPTATGYDLLLFEHPSAGIQIPAGTVEPGERAEQAALREAGEETGLWGLAVEQTLGYRDEILPADERVIVASTRVHARPDHASIDWAHLHRGITVRVERHEGDFTQVTYQEADRLLDPQYVTYQITGWVPNQTLTHAKRRHFFRLGCYAATGESWWIDADHHYRWRIFWAASTDLPAIVYPQNSWLDLLGEAALSGSGE